MSAIEIFTILLVERRDFLLLSHRLELPPVEALLALRFSSLLPLRFPPLLVITEPELSEANDPRPVEA
jgi:hypothetical protein